MNEPFDALKRHYEVCDEANPTRGLPDPVAVRAIRLRGALNALAGALLPAGISVGLGLALLVACSQTGSMAPTPSSMPIFKQQLREAGLAQEDAIHSQPAGTQRTEAKAWRA
ncbi:MAG: hypothetical protein HZC36_12080 [Armatimonadetes bacterium]|nr:hypothetical protein [Armatimonadota bacterium]